MGDLLFCMPAVQSLRARYPHAWIAMLTLPYTAPLAWMYPEVDDVIEVDTNRIRTLQGLLDRTTWSAYWKTYKHLRAHRFDLAISMYGRMGSLCAFLSGARSTLGYREEAYPHLLSRSVPGGRNTIRQHQVTYSSSLATIAGAPKSRPQLALPVSETGRLRSESLLRDHGIGRGDRLLVISPGSVNGSAKRWPAVNWARFADRVRRESGVAVALVGSARERSIAQEVIRSAHEPIVSLTGSTDIPLLAAVLARADLVASADSGPLHMAVALRRPLLAVYGPTDPAVYGPCEPAAPTVVHRADIPCSPCYSLAATAECPLGDPICMRLVTVEHMVESALRLLDQP